MTETARIECMAGVYTPISDGESSVRFRPSLVYGGRMVIADSQPPADAGNYLTVREMTPLEGIGIRDRVWYMPLGDFDQTIEVARSGGRTRLLVVASRGELTHNELGSAATDANRAHENRVQAFAGAGGILAETARLSELAFRTSSSGEEDVSGFAFAAHIEYNGVPYPVTWDGEPVAQIPSGAIDFQSDPVRLPDIPPGAELWFVRRRVYDVGAVPCYVTLSAMNPLLAGESYVRGAVNAPSRIGIAGPLVTGSGWTSTGATSLPVLLGKPIDPDAAAIGIAAASIERGQADNWGSGSNGAGGYIRRGLYLGTPQAYVNMALTGETAAFFRANSKRRRQYFKYLNVGLQGYGGNDFSTGRTKEDTFADMRWLNQQFRAAGADRTGLLKMFVKATRVDGGQPWTIANQTPNASFITFRDYILAQFDALIDAGLATGIVTASDAVKTAEELWLDNMTTDGTHPLPAGHAAVAPLLQPSMVAAGLLDY